MLVRQLVNWEPGGRVKQVSGFKESTIKPLTPDLFCTQLAAPLLDALKTIHNAISDKWHTFQIV